LVHRRLELAGRARFPSRRGAGRGRRLVRARPGPVPAGRADPGAETALQLQLGGGIRRRPAALLGADGDVRRTVPGARARVRRQPLRSPLPAGQRAADAPVVDGFLAGPRGKERGMTRTAVTDADFYLLE